MPTLISSLLNRVIAGDRLHQQEALYLADCDDTALLAQTASILRDQGFSNVITYSKKLFIPLTHLCRDVCHYCTFAQTPKFIEQAYMPVEQVLEQAKKAQVMGCKEALFTLGEKPELRYNTARKALEEMGFASTLEYVAYVAGRVFKETGILPHINAGCMTADEMAMLRKVSASMGIMLESVSQRLCEKGMPHYGSPDKEPARRLETIKLAGEASVPFTTGILIGIGETRLERIESLLAIRELHEQYGHIQEIIIQNFRAKPNTQMAQAPEPDLNELLWTIAVAKIIFGASMSIQVPPNLSPGVLEQIIASGINDWGGVSPITPDYVNPEAPWPHLDHLAQETRIAGKTLYERLTVYPSYVNRYQQWLDSALWESILDVVDAQGYPREDQWLTGSSEELPTQLIIRPHGAVSPFLVALFDKVKKGITLDEGDIVQLFSTRANDFAAVCEFADTLREQAVGKAITYTVNRNINYTNICYFKCKFCAFSKGKLSENLRGKPYDLSPEEITRRTIEAWERGANEVCMQGGIHPSYDGNTYITICHTVKSAVPNMHIHAFSPLEVWQGAATLGLSLAEYLQQLKLAGLGTLPGTAAEILDDEVRAILCPDKINTEQWLEVMRQAHLLGIRTTATIMFGHVDGYQHWARHLLRVLALQKQTQGFTEFVPLPFVASEAPIYLKGLSRKGPSLRESLLMHAVARIVFHGFIPNIQASWVKLGEAGVKTALQCGANDMGGTLMNESITRAAGASHGEELSVSVIEEMIQSLHREPRMRNTLYNTVSSERQAIARVAKPLSDIILTDANVNFEKVRLLKPGGSLDTRDSIEV